MKGIEHIGALRSVFSNRVSGINVNKCLYEAAIATTTFFEQNHGVREVLRE